jgi:antagonist of KipI
MSILVEKPGILTTVQDLGRFGYQKLGINPGGAMDPVAARLVNILLGNNETDAVLEMHFPAPHLAFESDAICALGGADFAATLDGVGIDNWRPFFAPRGSVLKFNEKRFGNRAYFAVMGGFDIDPWLGSASTNLAAKFGGLAGRTLRQHDKIRLRSAVELTRLAGASISTRLIPAYSKFPTIRIIAGAEFELLSQHGRDMLLNRDFSISNDSNRMGFRLTGEPIALSAPLEMVSSAVSVGTIQLLADGQLIILMADHQTTGGYPRLAHVIAHDLPLVAQLGSNDKIKFEQVDIGQAEELSMQFERDLSFFRVACRFQGNSGKDQSREDRP